VIFPYMAVPTRQPVPSLGGQQVRYRPVIAVVLGGSPTPQLRDGLLDTGADDTVFSEALQPPWASTCLGRSSGPLRWQDVRTQSSAARQGSTPD
jgi:hypothetical protein